MTTLAKIVCNKLEPLPDPEYGSPCARSSHGLSLILNGSRLILHGGEHVSRTPIDHNQVTWAADLVDDTWQWRRILPSATTIPPDRVGHAQAAFHDKIVYIFGGRAGVSMGEKAMNDLWKLNASGVPGTEIWTRVEADETSDPPPESRSFHKMVCVDTSLYVFGGCGVNGRLADLHRFDIIENKWHNLGASSLLRGRGGANLLPLSSGKSLAVIAGFCGEETADGHCFDIAKNTWEESLVTNELHSMRPRSVCVSGSYPSIGLAIIFGGEVDPSDRGHEGAGAFENDIVQLDEGTGKCVGIVKASTSEPWPETRGWSDAASQDNGNGTGHMFIFGGLSGDDVNPRRLDDLWRLDIQAA